jgi:hypothetical protein
MPYDEDIPQEVMERMVSKVFFCISIPFYLLALSLSSPVCLGVSIGFSSLGVLCRWNAQRMEEERKLQEFLERERERNDD